MAANKIMPIFTRISMPRMNPSNASGIAAEEEILTIGKIALLIPKGAYFDACWIAWPVSWAATPSAATEVLSYTVSDKFTVLFEGL